MLPMRFGVFGVFGIILTGLLVPTPEAEARKVPPPVSKPVPPPPPPPGVPGGVPGGVPAEIVDAPDGPDAGPEPPLVEATATVWAMAGSRSWTGCSKVASEAGKQLSAYGEEVNNFRENHHWAIQAGECPNAPEVLTMAARAELLRRFDLPEGLDGNTDLAPLETEQGASRARAIAWIDAAEAELRRRRDKRGLGLEYWRARALLASGELEPAREDLRRGVDEATIEGWKLRRLLAVAELYSGDLDAALIQANRATIDAPYSDRLISLYVLALVLDRAGDPAGAARRMRAALDMDGDGRRCDRSSRRCPCTSACTCVPTPRASAVRPRAPCGCGTPTWHARNRSHPSGAWPSGTAAPSNPCPPTSEGSAHADEGRAASGSGAPNP